MPYLQWMAKSKVLSGVHGFSWRKKWQESQRHWSGIKCTIASSPSLWPNISISKTGFWIFIFFFTSFQYRIALILNLRDNNRGFMNHQSVFRLRKPRCNTRSLFTKQQVWCPEYGTLRRAYYGYMIFYAISFKILVPKWNSLG